MSWAVLLHPYRLQVSRVARNAYYALVVGRYPDVSLLVLAYAPHVARREVGLFVLQCHRCAGVVGEGHAQSAPLSYPDVSASVAEQAVDIVVDDVVSVFPVQHPDVAAVDDEHAVAAVGHPYSAVVAGYRRHDGPRDVCRFGMFFHERYVHII